MKEDYRDKLIKKELKELLMNMHKGASFGLTLTAIIDVVKGFRYLDAKKVTYVLQGLKMPDIEGHSTLGEDKAYMRGYNDAVEENNFAIQLAIDAFTEISNGGN